MIKLLCPICKTQFYSQNPETYTLVERGKCAGTDIYQCPCCGIYGDNVMWLVLYAYEQAMGEFNAQLCDFYHTIKDTRVSYIMLHSASKSNPCNNQPKEV